jgi:two-component system response regulator QseB
MVKPFDLNELIARINAITRRYQGRMDNVIKSGTIELNVQAKSVTQKGQPIVLTAKELKVITFLMERKGDILSKTSIEEALYGWDEECDSNTVEVTVYNLRKKLGKDVISTIRGVGYIMS